MSKSAFEAKRETIPSNVRFMESNLRPLTKPLKIIGFLFLRRRKGIWAGVFLMCRQSERHRQRWRDGIEGPILWKAPTQDGQYAEKLKKGDLVIDILVTGEREGKPTEVLNG